MFDVAIMAILFLAGVQLLANGYSKLVSVLLVCYMGLAFAFATSTADSFAYSNAYNAICFGADNLYIKSMGYGIDSGFLNLMRIVSIFTKSYVVFRGFVFILSMLLLLTSVNIIKGSFLGSLPLYFLFPYVFDTFQIEFFLAYSVVSFGISFLVAQKSGHDLVFILSVLIATYIHEYCALFILLLLYKVDSKLLRQMLIVFLLVFIGANALFRVNLVSVINQLFPSLNSVLNLGHYVIGDSLNILTILLSITTFLVVFYYVYSVFRIDPSNANKVLFLINTASLLFLPFIFTSLNFERYFRPLLFLNSSVINPCKYKDDQKLRYTRLCIIALLLFRCSLHINYYLSNHNDLISALHLS